jgi:apolipoprotein N-acyltransferase
MRIASITGAICVIMGLSFLMSFALWLAHVIRLRAGNVPGFIAYITLWLTYEFISLNVNIVSPWINLGNGLSKDIHFIQWYELTGTAGGSLWILLSNLFLSIFLVSFLEGKKRILHYLIIWLAIIIIPSAGSFYRYYTIKPNSANSFEVVIIQPNTDPYTEKFTIPFKDQLQKVLVQVNSEITDKTEWVITPETTIDDPANLDSLAGDKYIKMIKRSITRYPNINVVAGLVTFRLYPPRKEAPTVSARKIDASGLFYDHFNSAVQIDSGNSFGIYHKSKLVPGIEMQFSNGPGRFITRILPYLGGTKWGYGVQNDRTCFTHTHTSMKIAPVICYESAFGKFVTGYIRNGAEAIFIITNDGWWKNTIGYKQHLDFASVRAIETRRQVARAANTGVSCIIDIKGKRIIQSDWWHKTELKGEIFPETRLTPYVRHGDYLLVISSVLSIIMLLVIFMGKPYKKN